MAECNDPECVQARTRLQDARNKILALCSLLDQLRKTASSWNTAIAALLAAAAALAVAAAQALAVPIIGIFAAIALLVTAGLLLILAATFAVIAAGIRSQISDAEKELAAANAAFANAVAEVMASCPPECWEGLDQPQC